MTLAGDNIGASLEQSIKEEARRLGFVLAGVTTPDPPPHAAAFEQWISQARHGTMNYLGTSRSHLCRSDPRQLMPECKSILVLAAPYWKPDTHVTGRSSAPEPRGRIAAYAWGQDYHHVLLERLKEILAYIERQVGHPVSSRCYTDTGPVLERDLAQRAGLGWIGKNTCLINPKAGSYFLLAEMLLDLELEPDVPFSTDHCGTCTRCIDACPTSCILPDRTLDAQRCVSYLTIELKDSIPVHLRHSIGDWVFGCDVCQMVCPWNRFAPPAGDPAFAPVNSTGGVSLIEQLQLSEQEFAAQFRMKALKRSKHRGYLRNLSVAAGNIAAPEAIPALESAMNNADSMVQEHAQWAIERITAHHG